EPFHLDGRPDLGRHHRRRPPVHPSGLVGTGLPADHAVPHRAVIQPVRRGTQGALRPGAEMSAPVLMRGTPPPAASAFGQTKGNCMWHDAGDTRGRGSSASRLLYAITLRKWTVATTEARQ